MRDKCDLYTLISNNALEGIQAPFDKNVTEEIRKKYKIADVSLRPQVFRTHCRCVRGKQSKGRGH